MKKNSKLYIGVIALIILVAFLPNSETNRGKMQSVVNLNECFSDSDCAVPVKDKYCDVKYSCEMGRCYTEDIKCPEICNNGIDDDLDMAIDCDDSDCFSSPDCRCEQMSYSKCLVGRCYCDAGFLPRWAIYTDDSRCICATGG